MSPVFSDIAIFIAFSLAGYILANFVIQMPFLNLKGSLTNFMKDIFDMHWKHIFFIILFAMLYSIIMVFSDLMKITSYDSDIPIAGLIVGVIAALLGNQKSKEVKHK